MSVFNSIYKKNTSTSFHMALVQLCVARNKHRRSAKNYKGIAKVKTRRECKGSFVAIQISTGVQLFMED